MDDKLGLADAKSSSNTEIAEENPNVSQNGEQQEEGNDNTLPRPQQSSSRTPFTNLSQVDADLALARTLQEQERAYMMLRFNNSINNNEAGSDYGSWESGSYLHGDDADFRDPDDHDHHHHETDGGDDDEEEEDDEDEDEDEDEDAFDVHAHAQLEEEPIIEIDPAMYSSDEAYARALQDAEEREMAARLLAFAGIHDHDEVEDAEDHGGNSQDAWEEIDPDELSYEELLALGEVVGNESRGLSADTIATLPSVNYKTGSNQNGSNDSCVICRIDYEDAETLTLLSCKHSYHSECINNWLKINKVCPVCSTEVSTSGHS